MAPVYLMNQRSYRATDIVVLPRTDAIGAVALATELIRARRMGSLRHLTEDHCR
jgi:hypothetical protein